MGEDHVTQGLPADLVSVLRDHSLVIPQDAAVFEVVGAWADAPANTLSAEITVEPDIGLFETIYRAGQVGSSTTPAAC